jgi:fused signal recognition particle receptor
MPAEIWYLGLLVIGAGAALIVPAVRRWDRQAPSETRPAPSRPAGRPRAVEADRTARPRARVSAPAVEKARPRPGRPAPKPTPALGPKAAPPAAPAEPVSPGAGIRVRPPAPPEEAAPTEEIWVAEPGEEIAELAPEELAPEELAPEELAPEPLVIEEPVVIEEAPPELLEQPAPTAGRMGRLRARLSKSQNIFGRGLLALLSRDRLDEDTWEEIEDTLISADVGVDATRQIVDRLRERARVEGTADPGGLRDLLADELLAALDPAADRTLRATPVSDRPAVVLVVGVNGSGKTTTCGKIARVLVADGHSVVLGAADTFRAAAAEQLTTWAGRVGAEVVRGPEGSDPAAVAFDAVRRGTETGVDTVLIDTAGRLQNKVGLMDELGKVKRVIERHGPVDETLLVLDATTGQNGLEQARKFTETSGVTGIVLTKLDGTAKGGVVIAIARELNLPIRYVGIGEKVDDLLPFDAEKYIQSIFEP